MNRSDLKEAEVKTQFNNIIDELEKWGRYVDTCLNKIAVSIFGEYSVHVQKPASSRVKDINSYCQKALYRNKGYRNPIVEITDKVGTRIVLLYTEDVKRISSEIENCSNWKFKERSRDSASVILQNPEMFSYESEHFIVMPDEEYETSCPKEILTCEIQVRTLLQHAYAEVSHDTIYKTASPYDRMILRKLASAMAFIEEADEKFIQVYKEMEKSNTITSQILSKIQNIYKGFGFNKNVGCDIQTFNQLIGIYSNEELNNINENIEEYCKKPTNYIPDVVNGSELALFQDPTILIAFFGMSKLQNTTWTKWPFTYESALEVAKALNLSIDSIR